MSSLSRLFYLSAGAALGAGATYYLSKKDKLDIQDQPNDLWDKTKVYSKNLVDKMDGYHGTVRINSKRTGLA